MPAIPAIFASLALIALLAFLAFRLHRNAAIIGERECGLFYRDGVFVRRLERGRHYLLPPWKRCEVIHVYLGEQITHGSLIDVMSRDGLPLRLSASAGVGILDPRAWHLGQALTHLTNAVNTALADQASEQDLEGLKRG